MRSFEHREIHGSRPDTRKVLSASDTEKISKARVAAEEVGGKISPRRREIL